MGGQVIHRTFAYRTHAQCGFTLIEISIVLVIIGLVVGGIFVARELIRASELRHLVSTVDKIETSVLTFRLKYNCIPGDCERATQFGLGTNGNGNQELDVGPPQEPYAFWAHLANADLWAGSFTGLQGPGGFADCTLNVNCPQLKISGGTILMVPRYFRVIDPINGVWSLGDGNYLFVGNDAGPINSWPLHSFLTGSEAHQIDSKIDDGMALTGKYASATYAVMYAHQCEGDAVGSSTSVTAADQPGYYRTDASMRACSFMIKMPF